MAMLWSPHTAHREASRTVHVVRVGIPFSLFVCFSQVFARPSCGNCLVGALIVCWPTPSQVKRMHVSWVSMNEVLQRKEAQRRCRGDLPPPRLIHASCRVFFAPHLFIFCFENWFLMTSNNPTPPPHLRCVSLIIQSAWMKCNMFTEYVHWVPPNRFPPVVCL